MLIVVAFSNKYLGLVDISEGAGENVGRKGEVLSTIICMAMRLLTVSKV
jgi:hypothetical protein